MKTSLKAMLTIGAAALIATATTPAVAQAQDSEPIQIALADLPEVETLFFLVGLARAQEKGLNAEVTFFNGEDLAIQAILSGQADLGLGSPYSVIQRSPVPVRLFYQVSKIIFFPVVKAEIEDWQDMEGVSIATQQRGGPLEALANIVSEQEGISLGDFQYVPGSESRVVALTQGHLDAALIDLLNKNMILEQNPDEFHVLPWTDKVVTDEALFARLDWIEENEDTVKLLIAEMLEAASDICADPAIIAEERERFDLLADLPEELANQLTDYYTEAIAANVYSCDGGSAEAAHTDIEVLASAGQLQGSAEDLKVEDFWYLEPLREARAETGTPEAGTGGDASPKN